MANLTPSDVRNVRFAKPPFGRRGYDEQQVDVFLDEVERTLVALTEEIAALRAQLGGGASAPGETSTGAGAGGVVAELDQIKTRLARIEAALTSRVQAPASDPLFGNR
jgi:DivIVA domain-containing protein